MLTEAEFFELHSILAGVVEEGLGQPPDLPNTVKQILARKNSSSGDQPVSEAAHEWLEVLDWAVSPYLLRKYLKKRELAEPTIQALVRLLVGKKVHALADREKVEWLMSYLFRLREERTQIPTGWPKSEVQEMLERFDCPPLSSYVEELLMEFLSLLDEVKYLESFGQVTGSRIIERGRELKSQFQEDFFHPAVLAVIVNYNLLFGKKFRDLLKAAIREVREFAHDGPQNGTSDLDKLLEADYRATADDFRQLSRLRQQDDAFHPPTNDGARLGGA